MLRFVEQFVSDATIYEDPYLVRTAAWAACWATICCAAACASICCRSREMFFIDFSSVGFLRNW